MEERRGRGGRRMGRDGNWASGSGKREEAEAEKC